LDLAQQAASDCDVRWRGSSASLWAVLESCVTPGSKVAIIGSGNCDDLPFAQIAECSSAVDLYDVVPESSQEAIQRLEVRLRDRCRVIDMDVTGGIADWIVDAAGLGPSGSSLL